MEIRERREVGSGREGGGCDEDTESGGEDAWVPAAAARIPASWCLRRWTIGAGATEIQTVEAGSKAAAMMKMQAQIFGRRDRGQRQPSRLRAPPARRRSTRPAAAGAKDSCMDVDVHAAAVQIAMKSG